MGNVVSINYTLFIQMAGFLFVLFILNFILYRPLLAKIRERFSTIDELTKKANLLKIQAEENEKIYEKKVKEAEMRAKENYAKKIEETLKEKDRKTIQELERAKMEISKLEEEIRKEIDIELESSKDYSIELANKIYRQLVG